MHDTKERLSLLWIFALLNYLYADVVALFAIAGSRNSFEPLPPWALMASAVLMEIPIAMILASRLLPFRANRLANIIAGGILTLVNGFLTFIPPLAGWGRPPAFPEYLFFATIETVATSVIIWRAGTWSEVGSRAIRNSTGESKRLHLLILVPQETWIPPDRSLRICSRTMQMPGHTHRERRTAIPQGVLVKKAEGSLVRDCGAESLCRALCRNSDIPARLAWVRGVSLAYK